MPKFNGHTILVVDDDDFTREMYGEVFRNTGFQVFEARDGIEGLDIATREKPEVIFTGIVMPRMDGFSMIEALRKNTSTADIPVFVSSHLGREEDRKEAEKIGAKGFIIRDVTSPNEVAEVVARVFMDGGEFAVKFDYYNLDAPGLAKEAGLNENFQCLECNESMHLRLRLDRSDPSWYKVRFTCPKCGWQRP